MRVGQGFDIHPLVADRALWLGGVRIPSSHGAEGDSDADVLLHATMDACLGAAGLGDLGSFFAPGQVEPGTPSRLLWQQLWPAVTRTGLRVLSLDTTVVLEAPRLLPHRQAMVAELTRLTGSPHVSVKFKSADGLGPIGEQNAVAAFATVLMGDAGEERSTASAKP